MKFCTYLTAYYGNKMPMYYIGSTSVKKILKKNYHGSVSSKKWKSIWLDELKHYPELFKTTILTYHRTKDEARYRERLFQLSLNVKYNDMYTNEAIAGNRYADRTGFKATKETRTKIRKILLERDDSIKKRISTTLSGRSLSEAHKEKISIGLRGAHTGMKRSAEARRKMSEAQKKRSDLRKPKSLETKLKMAEAQKIRRSKEKRTPV